MAVSPGNSSNCMEGNASSKRASSERAFSKRASCGLFSVSSSGLARSLGLATRSLCRDSPVWPGLASSAFRPSRTGFSRFGSAARSRPGSSAFLSSRVWIPGLGSLVRSRPGSSALGRRSSLGSMTRSRPECFSASRPARRRKLPSSSTGLTISGTKIVSPDWRETLRLPFPSARSG